MTATGFGVDPEGYDAARPDYPDALYARLESCGLLEGARVFEVGAGTGTATRRLLRALPAELVAIEPDPRMARLLRARTPVLGDRLRIVSATFEAATLPDGAFDLGLAATSFHWLDQVPALAKAVRLLRPGGWWAMWWTVFADPETPDAFEQASDPLFASIDGLSSQRRGSTPFALDGMRLRQMREAGLIDLDTQHIRWSVTMTAERVRALTATFSQVMALGPERREPFLDQVAELVRVRFGGAVERRFVTALLLGRRPPAG